MEVEDLKLVHDEHVKVLREVFAATAQPVDLTALLQQLKQTVKNRLALKDALQEFVSFFMLCQSNHQPHSPDSWRQVFDSEIMLLDKMLSMRNRFTKKLLWKGLEGFKQHKSGLAEAPRMSLGQYAMTLKTEQSQKMHRPFYFQSEKCMPVLCDTVMETPVKESTKLKSKAFYAWTKYLHIARLNKQQKQQEVEALKRAHEYNIVTLKLRALYSCKQFVQQRRAERAKTERLRTAALQRHKSSYFQAIVDCYTISKIEVILSKKVLKLTNRLTKVRALRKLQKHAANVAPHKGYANYRCVLFLKYLIQQHCDRTVMYDSNQLPLSLNAGSRTDKANLQNQLRMFGGMLLSKAFRALKIRTDTIKAFKRKINIKLLTDVTQAYRQQMTYSRNHRSQLKELSLVNQKYFFRRLLLEVSKIPIRKARFIQDVQAVKDSLTPLFIKSFFRWFATRFYQRRLLLTANNANKAEILGFRKRSVIRNFSLSVATIKSLKQNTIGLKGKLIELQRREVFNQFRARKHEKNFREGMVEAGDKLYESRLSGRVFNELVRYVREVKSLDTNTHSLYEQLTVDRKLAFVRLWVSSHERRITTTERIRQFELRQLRKYISAIARFSKEEQERINPLRQRVQITLTKQAWRKLRINAKQGKSIETTAKREALFSTLRKGFEALLKNRHHKQAKRELAIALHLGRMQEFLSSLAIEREEKRNTEKAVAQIIKQGSVRRIIQNMRCNLTEQKSTDELEKLLERSRKTTGLCGFVRNLTRDWQISDRFKVSTAKLQLTILRKYIKRVANDLTFRKQKKQLVAVAARRQVYLVRQSCRYIRKVVPKLCQLKSCQRRYIRVLLARNLKKLKQKTEYHRKLVERRQLRIAPVLAHHSTRLLTRIFDALQRRIASRKNLACCLVRSLKAAELRVYSDSLLTIFENYSFKSRSIAVGYFYKKRCFGRLMESFVRRSNARLLEFKAIKAYARTLLHKAMNSFIINNQDRENTANYTQQFHDLNVQKWKARLEGIGHSRPMSLRHSHATAAEPRRSRPSNSFLR